VVPIMVCTVGTDFSGRVPARPGLHTAKRVIFDRVVGSHLAVLGELCINPSPTRISLNIPLSAIFLTIRLQYRNIGNNAQIRDMDDFMG